MPKIHWLGTGLSAVPGLRRLIATSYDVVVWNRTTDKAQLAVGDLTSNIKKFDFDEFSSTLVAGDVAVSMLPGEWHVPVANACIAASAHFVSSSYISPEMRELDKKARSLGLMMVNEVGLDPGIDHLMAHWLIADYRASAAYDVNNDISFISYCGGIPKIPNDFRYKFSWSPLGVLKALRSPSKSIRDFENLETSRPGDALGSYVAPLPESESFEVYPNRDSLPFIEDYKFGADWKIKQFVRGTLRLNGWADAWADVFTEIETLEGEAGDARLTEMSDEFWTAHAYDENDPDRVVLCVEFKAEKDGQGVYNKTYVLDAWGDNKTTAMANLVSMPVSLAVEAILAKEIGIGVTAAPSSPELVNRWMTQIDQLAQHLEVVDHIG